MTRTELKEMILNAKSVGEIRDLKEAYGDALIKSVWREIDVCDRRMIHHKHLKSYPAF